MTANREPLPDLPRRPREAHKGQFGHVLVVAGSPGMTGAGCMAASAAQRAGAGLVTLALPRSLNIVAEIALGSAMSMPLPETCDGALGLAAGAHLLERAHRFNVAAIGPGLRTAEETQRMVRRLVARLQVPIVVDADGLNALAQGPDVLQRRRAATILTPHPGEMSRLVGCASVAEVQSDRTGTALRFARQHGVVVVLKGHGTVITDGERVWINETGNPGMATGGTGDVLTGLIAGLLCQGLGPFDASRLGAFVHGLAGDVAAARKGELSLVAEDVLGCVPAVFKTIEDLRADERNLPLDCEAVRAAVMG